MPVNFYSSSFSNRPASQAYPIRGRENDMKMNNAGGYAFSLDKWSLLDRFLILGSELPTYYVGSKQLTIEAASSVMKCIEEDGLRTVNTIVQISMSGRAPKNDSAVFALALCAVSKNKETAEAAYAALQKVCRIGTHLFQFAAAIDSIGKWNSSAKKGISSWYQKKQDDQLSIQLLKYQSREGWSHRDVLRLAHVKPVSQIQSNIFKYVTSGFSNCNSELLPLLVHDYESLKNNPTEQNAIQIISKNPHFTWEMIPTHLLKSKNIMAALLPNMGMTAILRKLGQLTSIGVLAPFSPDTKVVLEKISNTDVMKALRVHPITILNALNQYSKAQGKLGKLSWKPVQQVVDALNDAFYESFNFIETTGKNHFIGVDCSGSMFGAEVSGASGLTAAEVSAVMALAIAKREPNYFIAGFSTTMKELKISPSMRLDSVLKEIQKFPWSGTDCSQPMIYADKNGMSNVDKFITITDNETWAGPIHAAVAFANYAEKHNTDSRYIVCATSTTGFSIADPNDSRMLDVVGFDSAVPQLIQSF